MRRLTLVAAAALGLSLLPRPVLAGPLLEASVGMGAQQDPSTFQRTQTSLMLAPGWEFAGILKLELGFGANLADTASSRFELELRPMLVVSPPLFPLYLRGIAVVQNLVNGPTTAGYGGALGYATSTRRLAGRWRRRTMRPAPGCMSEVTVPSCRITRARSSAAFPP